MKYKWKEEDLKNAVESSTSIRQTIQKLGLVPAGGNYSTIKKEIKRLNIDCSHFKGKGWNKGISTGHTKPIDYYLKKNMQVQSNRLKKRLIKEGIKNHSCENCGIDKWNEMPAPLELDHINGDRNDNRIENLRILCPNCHAQTSNYRGKNIGSACANRQSNDS